MDILDILLKPPQPFIGLFLLFLSEKAKCGANNNG